MFRLFPIMLVLCVALLGVRIADMVDRQQSLSGALFIEATHAEEKAKTEEKEKKDEKKEEDGDHPAPGSKDGDKKSDKKADEKAPSLETGKLPEPKMPAKEEKRFSESEVEILQRLAERHKKLEQWQKEMELRESVLKLTEQKVDGKLQDLRKLKTDVEKLLELYNEKEDAKIRSLVKIYENMKPKDAARIFDELDNEVLLIVIDKMKEAKSATILAKMNPAKAKEITTQLADQRRLKTPDSSL
jgi:flagellar motility protein MotE (MotC chaperone)